MQVTTKHKCALVLFSMSLLASHAFGKCSELMAVASKAYETCFAGFDSCFLSAKRLLEFLQTTQVDFSKSEVILVLGKIRQDVGKEVEIYNVNSPRGPFSHEFYHYFVVLEGDVLDVHFRNRVYPLKEYIEARYVKSDNPVSENFQAWDKINVIKIPAQEFVALAKKREAEFLSTYTEADKLRGRSLDHEVFQSMHKYFRENAGKKYPKQTLQQLFENSQ